MFRLSGCVGDEQDTHPAFALAQISGSDTYLQLRALAGTDDSVGNLDADGPVEHLHLLDVQVALSCIGKQDGTADFLLAAQPYGWEYMVDTAAYMESADLDGISTVTTAEMANMPETELIDQFRESKVNLKDFKILSVEKGQLGVGGISRVLRAPAKIVWFNQTRVMRLFTPLDDEILVTKYIETVIRRTFGTKDAMKMAKKPEKTSV